MTEQEFVAVDRHKDFIIARGPDKPLRFYGLKDGKPVTGPHATATDVGIALDRLAPPAVAFEPDERGIQIDPAFVEKVYAQADANATPAEIIERIESILALPASFGRADDQAAAAAMICDIRNLLRRYRRGEA